MNMKITEQPEWLFQYDEILDTGKAARIQYDREGDILEVFFADGSGRGLELADEIVLRYDPETATPLSLILLTFSHIIKPTEYGQESFRLNGMEHLSLSERQNASTTCGSDLILSFHYCYHYIMVYDIFHETVQQALA